MTTTTLNPVILAACVDRLAMIKAIEADLKKEGDQIKAQLIDAELPVIESNAYRAAVSMCDGRVVIDWKAIAEKLEPSRQLVTAHTSQGAPFAVVRVSARKG
jgi:hypothetical protein